MVPDYSSTGESELVSRLIEDAKSKAADASNIELAHIEPEAHYDHYGNRGAADLYIEEVEDTENGKIRNGSLYEVKSEHAVEQANGAGDIIRQYKRMRKYFFQDGSWQHPNRIKYELVFIPTEKTVQHVSANKTMYDQLVDRDSYKESSRVFFRAPDEYMPPGIPNLKSPFDDVRKNLVYTRPDYARAAGVGTEIFHEVGRELHDEYH